MTASSQAIANQALSLSAEERAFVANALLQSLEKQPFSCEAEDSVVQKRISELKSGKVKALSHDEFLIKTKIIEINLSP